MGYRVSTMVLFFYDKGKIMKKSSIAIALAAALLGMATAQASEFDGLYIGGKLGVNRSDISGANTASKEDVETFGFEEGYNWDMGKFLVGGDFYADFNQKTDRTNVSVYSGSTTLGLDLKLGLPNGSWMPYAKAGWARVTGTGVFPASQFKYTNDLHLALGVEYKLAPRWSITGELSSAASRVNGSKLDNKNLTVGLNYYFGGPAAAPAVIAAAPVVVKEEPAPAPAPVMAPAPAPVAPPPVVVKEEPKPVANETWKTLLENKPVCIEGTNFEFDSAKLRSEDIKKLNDVVSFTEKYKDTQLEASGHTCNIGTNAYNQKLSERRAESVKAYLVKKGVAPQRVVTVGYGETRPMADNKTRAGREQNRRVEICTVLKEEKKVRAPQ